MVTLAAVPADSVLEFFGKALCRHWIGAETRFCLEAPTRSFPGGHRCPAHTPSALEGKPEPGRHASCPPARCYCGRPECPAFPTFNRGAYLDGETVVDFRAKASGKRRSSVQDFRAARDVIGQHQQRERNLREGHQST